MTNAQKAVEYYRKNNTNHDTDELAIEAALRDYGVTWGQFVRELNKG